MHIKQSRRVKERRGCIVLCTMRDLKSGALTTCFLSILQRPSFSLRVSVMKARNMMAKDANGENIHHSSHTKLNCTAAIHPWNE